MTTGHFLFFVSLLMFAGFMLFVNLKAGSQFIKGSSIAIMYIDIIAINIYLARIFFALI